MKTYIVTLSKTFLKGHPRAGEPTYFAEKFFKGQGKYRAEIDEEFGRLLIPKIHTMRANYGMWAKRIAEVQRGEAILSVRVWSGAPYRSAQVTLANLDHTSGLGVQELRFMSKSIYSPYIGPIDEYTVSINFSDRKILSDNDGLSLDDWQDWFASYDLSEPMALIHFTPFRY